MYEFRREHKMAKFWTVVNGVLGTAHHDRDGRMVDFRLMDHTEVHNNLVVVYPPKDQANEVVPFTLEPIRSEKQIIQVDYPCPGQQWVRNILYAQYRGVEVSAATNSFAEWYDPEAEEKARKEAEERRIKWELERQKKFQFLSSISDEDILPQVSRSEVDRLRAGTVTISTILERVLSDQFRQRFGDPEGNWWIISHEIDLRDLEKLKTNLLEYHNRQRAERKQRWLNREKTHKND